MEPKEGKETQIKPKIKWNKCDKQYYCDLLECGLGTLCKQIPDSQFEMDLMVASVNRTLYEASAAAAPAPKTAKNRRKNNLPLWNEDISLVVARSKQAHKEWQAAGSPTSPDNPLVKNRKDARRLMRKTIRQQVYADNQDKYQEIMDANERDTKTFYKLVNQQRTVKSMSTEILYFDGKTCSSVNEVAAAFSEHFERLATPSDNPDYDAGYKAQVEFDTLLIEMITQQQTCCIKPVSPKEISNIINSFKTNKAQDIFGLSSEHLKYAPDCLYHILSSLMNCILRSGYVPQQLKQGILTPVLKKKKDATRPTNYRGIIVLSILGKVLERVLQNRTKVQIESQQSKMQRGFTSNSSAVNAALIVSESQNEAKDLGEPLKLVTLDACKAFDVVWQDSLLRKIYNVGIQGSLWVCLKNLYRGAFSTVKWQGQVSEPFEIKQGVRQGGILSTLHYKLFNNDLLHLLQALGVGMNIGHIDCSCPTCADDVALLAKFLLCLQVLLTVVMYFLGRERYGINTSKSVEVILNKGIRAIEEGNPNYGNDKQERSDSELHLGVDRNSSANVDADGRAQTGRRTMYALMGAGAYGCSGVPAPLIAHLWKIYALPRMIYGLEVFTLTNKAMQLLEKVQRSILRHIQNLPPNTALTAVYGLLGLRPIEQELDLRKLTLLGNILSQKSTLEYEIAQRQMSVKGLDSNSWFSKCKELLHKYKLPSIYTLDGQIDSLESWKSQLKKHIDLFIEKEMMQDVKSSLKFLNTKVLSVGKIHHAWRSVPNDPRLVKRVYPKIRLLTGTYILQENRARFNQYEINMCCPLCGDGIEDRVHFLAVCLKLAGSRQGLVDALVTILKSRNTDVRIYTLVKEPQLLAQIILDCSVIADTKQLDINEDMLISIEKWSHNACFVLHQKRSELLGLTNKK